MTRSHQDRAWFCEELQRSKTSLYRLALSITGNPEDAAEAVAEGVCRAYERFGQLRSREKFQPWLMKIVRNEAYALCRGRRRTVPLDQLAEEPAVPGPQVDDTLPRAIMALNRPYREVIILYYYQELKAREIADILHVDVSTITARLSRARKQLREALKGWYYDE